MKGEKQSTDGWHQRGGAGLDAQVQRKTVDWLDVAHWKKWNRQCGLAKGSRLAGVHNTCCRKVK
uniref:Uncharacterized protein n=1 Tax=Heterorhabditis bacteriophora TaxID=37862 RepID=A0A1I7XSQ9_HETBA